MPFTGSKRVTLKDCVGAIKELGKIVETLVIRQDQASQDSEFSSRAGEQLQHIENTLRSIDKRISDFYVDYDCFRDPKAAHLADQNIRLRNTIGRLKSAKKKAKK